MAKTKEMQEKFEFDVFPKRDVVIVKGKSAKVWDEDGREYIDCVAGHGVVNVGHCNPKVVEAIKRQADTLITCPGIFYNDAKAILLEKLVGIAPPGLKKAFLCNSGAESVEAALKFARLTTGKKGIICAMRGFHGRTFGALSATFNPKYKEDFLPLVPGFTHVPFNNFDKLSENVDGDTAAVLLEVVQGEGGVNIGGKEYFDRVRKLCDDKGILMIIDEVQTGFCRTGSMFACTQFGIEPDMMCVAKSIAGGIPMGAVLCSDRVKSALGKHGSTFGGNPLSCAAASAAIDFMLNEKLNVQAKEKGAYLMEKLNARAPDKVREIRGLGLMIGIELKEKSKPYLVSLKEEGVLALPAGATVVRLLPPLTISYEELDTVAEKVLSALSR